jgi:HK97 family phage major capsid protein
MSDTKQKRDLQTVLGEMKEIQDEFRGKKIPEEKANTFHELAREAKEMQDEVDRDKLLLDVKRADEAARKMAHDLTPNGGEGPGKQEADQKDKPVGYVTLGDLAVASKGFQAYRENGFPKGGQYEWLSQPVSVVSGKGAVVPVTRKQIDAIQQKAVPDIGTRVIPFDRDPDLVLNEERREMRVIDVLNVVPTSSNNVEWVRRADYTYGAGTQSESTGGSAPGLKPEAAKEYELVSTPIRTHAVWMPVTEQQLSDWPQLSGLINGDLMYDLSVYRENQLLYGDGTGTNFTGLLAHADVNEARAEAGDNLIDRIRRAVTDIRRAHLIPNAILMDPLDWEEIVLTKVGASDDRYVWVVVTENQANRLWALPVIETVAMEDGTGERNILVGDFQRGATLYDRESTTISSGWIDDQFIRNMRTVLVESRSGFAVRRPSAFRKIQTQAYS